MSELLASGTSGLDEPESGVLGSLSAGRLSPSLQAAASRSEPPRAIKRDK
jgi:hypothetical protein